MNFLDNLNRKNQKMNNMFAKTPYFATQEIMVADKLYDFFKLYTKNRTLGVKDVFEQELKNMRKNVEKNDKGSQSQLVDLLKQQS